MNLVSDSWRSGVDGVTFMQVDVSSLMAKEDTQTFSLFDLSGLGGAGRVAEERVWRLTEEKVDGEGEDLLLRLVDMAETGDVAEE